MACGAVHDAQLKLVTVLEAEMAASGERPLRRLSLAAEVFALHAALSWMERAALNGSEVGVRYPIHSLIVLSPLSGKIGSPGGCPVLRSMDNACSSIT